MSDDKGMADALRESGYPEAADDLERAFAEDVRQHPERWRWLTE